MSLPVYRAINLVGISLLLIRNYFKYDSCHNASVILIQSVRPVMLGLLSTNNKTQMTGKKIEPEAEKEPTPEAMDKRCDQPVERAVVEEKTKSELGLPASHNQEPAGEKKTFLKPVTKRSRSKRKIGQTTSNECNKEQNEPVKTLLDITANYVIRNQQQLNNFYKSRLKHAWRMINSDKYSGDTLNQCYNAVKDLNKKTKLLRCIENDNITIDILMEEYGNSDIFLREQHMLPDYDPFEISEESMEIIRNFVESCD
ncbi:unnamed protein product [Acanthoscelides obtectus]|uniref:Uncharacterized protein n=1 Tax=Acanthoscelides obtectus TaxID=200917 RepID=A0A9P0MKB9_ACAOB|nr:unnamed protein product [Acanthoscelides obtectus]CAK1663243.1 hypothetical protein AOBTE_LOCUS23568 [Acanthoscelides obtectus]